MTLGNAGVYCGEYLEDVRQHRAPLESASIFHLPLSKEKTEMGYTRIVPCQR